MTETDHARARHFRGALLACLAALAAASARAELAPAPAVVAPGRTVTLEYTLLLEDGTLVETNLGHPVTFTPGQKEMFPRLEAALFGLRVDDVRSVRLEAEDAFGPPDPAAFREIPLARVPQAARCVGGYLRVPGYEWPVVVHEVRGDAAVLDLNHPLAGKTVVYQVHILAID
jgi:FKBP-type peptidyl-prolyl cis-trans isomerase 2